jgi:predicted anti-sigma-YlaC factor YlaD
MTANTPAHIPCNAVVELLTEYLEGALDQETADRIEAHLALCPPCVVFLDQLRDTVRNLGQLSVDNLPESTVDALEDAFRGFHPAGG